MDWEGNTSTCFQTYTLNGLTFRPVGITSSEVIAWLYVTSHNGNSVSRVQPGAIEVLSNITQGYLNGVGGAASFNTPYHLAWADTGGAGSLFIADTANQRIRRFDLEENQVYTYAGSGVAGYLNSSNALNARFKWCTGIGIGPSNEIYTVESSNHGVRKVGEQ